MDLFKDRADAARQLLERLKIYQGKNPLVLGIPRGAMPMAEIIADELDGELGAVLVHKIPAPWNEELAIGSIGLSGHIYKNFEVINNGISDEYIKKAAKEQLARLKSRQTRFHLAAPQCKDRIVIIVDDGIATGATAFAAIHEVRSLQPQKLIMAAGVIASHTANEMRPLVDELVVIDAPDLFFGVSQFFLDFREVTDDDVERILTRWERKRTAHAA